MKITSHPISISATLIETGMWHIQRYLIQKHGIDTADRDMAPLKWYVYTGRAPLLFLSKLLEAKPYMVARKLHIGGSYEETIQRVKNYIGFREAINE